MPLTGEAKAEYQRKYAARKAAEKENLEKAKQLDLLGSRYKSEVLPYVKLYELYFGIKENKEEDKDKKKPVIKVAGEKILGQEHTFESWLEMRDKARKDLFWLGQAVFKKDLTERTHRIVCNQFVQKNFDGVYHNGYTIGDVHRAIDKQERYDDKGNPAKEMMLLDSRGFFKSTINEIDCAQWILNVPDIRILILTGEYKLAVSFLLHIKSFFFLAEGSDPTTCHLLFPEYILTGVSGTSREPLECPARQHDQKEGTLWVNSIDANLSGWHCDLKKGDDVVTDENSNSEQQREKLKEKYDGTNNLVDEWGFVDHIGTRYFVEDWYGMRLKYVEDEYVPIKYFCRQCWTVKPDFVSIPLKKLTEGMVDLTFPEKGTFMSLRKKLLLNERQFRNQQLNEPSEDDDSPFKVTFNEDDLRRHVMLFTAAPKEGDVFICWDWAASANKYSDMSCGIAGRISRKDNKPVLIVLEVIFGRWKPSELALQIVSFNKKWNPKTTLIEKSNGAELLQLEVQRQAMKYSTVLNVYWKTPSNQPEAKRNRIKGVETLLNNEQLWFVAGPWLDDVFTQMVRYTGEHKTKGRKDDIPDALSFFSFFLPSTESNEDMKKMQEEQSRAQKLRMHYERLFGSTPTILTPSVQSVKPDQSADPRNRIFGNNGLHI